jgi:hypothetical protein
MACGDGNPLWVIPTKLAPESPPGGEALAAKAVDDA